MTIGDGHRSLIAKLNEIVKQAPVDLEVVFNCDHVEIHGLALIASWCAKFAAKVNLRAPRSRVRAYLEQTGYQRVLEDCVTLNAPSYDSIHHVALTLVHRQHPEIADTIPERLVDLFDSKIGLHENQKIPLSIMFAELIENVYRHAQSNSPAYVMAQAYPKSNALHVVVADTGIGIFASFRESNSAEVREKTTSEVRALEIATEKYVTSKTSRHQGYGLYIVRRLAELNGGQLRLMSGQTTRFIRSRRRPLGGSRVEYSMTDNQKWGGTAVSLMFNLNSELPIDRIWHELGPESGFEEDFFDDGP
ncbi:hypothetical protein B7486_01650 [cyanobacterium TDX16]|nr:hypothetical protein B7486_01650 [cyanobacterium TDX16]